MVYDLLPEWMKKFPPNYEINLSGVGGFIQEESYEDYLERQELPFFFSPVTISKSLVILIFLKSNPSL